MPTSNRVETECIVCHEKFMAKPSWLEAGRKFCSRECYNASNIKRMIECACAICGNVFSVTPDKAGTAKYCSRKCKGLARRNKTTAICEVCGSTYETWPSNLKAGRRHCSKECSYISLSLEKQGEKNPAWRGGC